MTNYAVGRNIPGYLSEGDVYVTGDYESAKAALIEDLDRYGDELYERGLSDAADEASELMEDVNLLSPGNEWYAVLPTSDSPHDLGLAFWLSQTDEEPAED
jgi:hypothetical protein